MPSENSDQPVQSYQSTGCSVDSEESKVSTGRKKDCMNEQVYLSFP